MKKKLFSIIAIAMLIATMIPSMSFAEAQNPCKQTHCVHEAAIGDAHYDTLSEAIGAAQDNETIKLLKDISVDVGVTINKAITIDLNNKVITATGAGYSSTRQISLKGNVTLKNGTIDEGWLYVTGANVVIEDVDVLIDNVSKDTVAGVSSTAYGMWVASSTSEVLVRNSKIDFTAKDSDANSGVYVSNAKKVTFENSSVKITQTNRYCMGAIYLPSETPEIIIDNSEFEYVGDDTYCTVNARCGSVLVKGSNSKIIAKTLDDKTGVAISSKYNTDAVYTIENGTISGKISTPNAGASKVAVVNVKGGTFESVPLFKTGTGTVSDYVKITGGKFKDAESSIQVGFAADQTIGCAPDASGYNVVTSYGSLIAKVGSTEYDDIDNAITAAKASKNKEITIVGNVTLNDNALNGLKVKTEGSASKIKFTSPDVEGIIFGSEFINASTITIETPTEQYTIRDLTTTKDRKIEKAVISGNFEEIFDEAWLANGCLYQIDSGYNTFTIDKEKSMNVAAKIGNRAYLSLSSAINTAAYNDDPTKNFDKVELLKDVTLTYGIGLYQPNAAFELDLGGHTVAASPYLQDNYIFAFSYAGSQAANNADVTIKNGRVDLREKAGYGISTNGMLENVNLTLENLDIKAPNGHGMYLPASGKVKMTNVNIDAMGVGVQTCAADVKLKNCKITTSGVDRANQKTEGDGLIPDGSAISVVNRPGYKAVPKVEIESGEYKSGNNVQAVRGYSWIFNAEQPSESLKEWEAAEERLEINGGIFSTDPFEYLGDGKNREKLYDNNFIVGENVVVENGKVVSGEFNEQDITKYVAEGSVEKAADGTIVIKKAEASTKTGDDSNLVLWIALMAIAVAGGTGTVLYRRKHNA